MLTSQSAARGAGRRKPGGAREARRARRRGQATPGTVRARRAVPTVELLDEEALVRIEAHADWIAREIGIEFRGDDDALQRFRAAGASVAGERVRFDPGHLRSLCATAPSTFRVEGRDASADIVLGSDHVVFMPAYGSPFVTDLAGGRRYATLEDFRNFVRLSYVTPYLQHGGGTVCEPVDVPVNKRHLDMVDAHLRLSNKPFMGSVTAPERARDIHRDGTHRLRRPGSRRALRDSWATSTPTRRWCSTMLCPAH